MVRILQIRGALAAAALAMACGGSGSGTSSTTSTTSPTGTCTASATSTTIVIQAGGAVCPSAITVSRGTQVTFVNQDSRGHDMFSDPHPDHTDCPEINQVGHLEPGQGRQTGNLVVAKKCSFHDHELFDNKSLQGTITIQ